MSPANKPPLPSSVRFRHEESNQYRVVHVDGFYGGPTPTGALFMQVYALLPPMPTEIVQEVTATGDLGREITRQVETSLERHIEAGLLMDTNVAKALRDWLTQQIEALDFLQKGRAK